MGNTKNTPTKGQPEACPIKTHYMWRPSDRNFYCEMVEIPKDLALDLVRYLAPSAIFCAETSGDDCQAGLHETRAEAHLARMQALADVVTTELSDHGIFDHAENVLRVLSISYETAGLVNRGAE